VDSGANEEDIRNFITSTLSGCNIAVRDEKTLLDIKRTLLAKAEGMFLYISLLAKTLIGPSTPNLFSSVSNEWTFGRKTRAMPKANNAS
jgi:hypothetical protein